MSTSGFRVWKSNLTSAEATFMKSVRVVKDCQMISSVNNYLLSSWALGPVHGQLCHRSDAGCSLSFGGNYHGWQHFLSWFILLWIQIEFGWGNIYSFYYLFYFLIYYGSQMNLAGVTSSNLKISVCYIWMVTAWKMHPKSRLTKFWFWRRFMEMGSELGNAPTALPVMKYRGMMVFWTSRMKRFNSFAIFTNTFSAVKSIATMPQIYAWIVDLRMIKRKPTSVSSWHDWVCNVMS